MIAERSLPAHPAQAQDQSRRRDRDPGHCRGRRPRRSARVPPQPTPPGSPNNGRLRSSRRPGKRPSSAGRANDLCGRPVHRHHAGAGTALVGTGGSTPIRGVWSGAPQCLADYLLAQSPDPAFSVPVLTLAGYYVHYAAEVGLRADVLWAQMLHETGFGRYGGSVAAGQNNFAGIGATGGGEAGSSFPTAEDGVKAQIAHMVAYVFTQDMAPWTNATVDPRYDARQEPRHSPGPLRPRRAMGGAGRWVRSGHREARGRHEPRRSALQTLPRCGAVGAAAAPRAGGSRPQEPREEP